jgi:hypothetical protein
VFRSWFAFGDLAVEIGPAFGVRLADLAHGCHMDGMVELAVPSLFGVGPILA